MYIVTIIAQANPTKKPVTTCAKVCCLNINLLVPTTPPSRINIEIYHIGLKKNISPNTAVKPVAPPIAAVCGDMFHHLFM